MNTEFTASFNWAKEADHKDSLAPFRDQFYIPEDPQSGEPMIYLCGNSLGLQPRRTAEYIREELEDWAKLGVEGHTEARHPWMPYHEFLASQMADLVGAKSSEVVVMNSLTVNLHLMMVSFYRPEPNRKKILIEYSPFPSDRYAVTSQILFHGYDPEKDLLELKPDDGELVSTESILDLLEHQGEDIALILLGGVNYYTGQVYDMARITTKAHEKGCRIGFDLAHAAGNIQLKLHDWGPDFAAWCSYKYLNSGPGSLAGVFVHERHANDSAIPRFAGWWGHDKSTRFRMGPDFVPMTGAEGWQLSNPPILSMAAIRASLDMFSEAGGMETLVKKSKKLTGYLEFLLRGIPSDNIRIITPSDPEQRGCQISIQVSGGDRSLFERLSSSGVIADWREPDVIRVAPVPLYNSFTDVFHFVEKLKSVL